MGKKTDPGKRVFAHALFMNGTLQKDICEQVGISAPTLNNWMKQEGWEEKRAATNITRTELVNKTLKAISDLLDRALKETNEDKLNGLSDKMSKLASTLQKLDKSSSVVDAIEVFINFGRWLKDREKIDKELTSDMVKAINRYQDLYINDRIARK
jgi:hypothetical protein